MSDDWWSRSETRHEEKCSFGLQSVWLWQHHSRDVLLLLTNICWKQESSSSIAISKWRYSGNFLNPLFIITHVHELIRIKVKKWTGSFSMLCQCVKSQFLHNQWRVELWKANPGGQAQALNVGLGPGLDLVVGFGPFWKRYTWAFF